MFNFNLILSWKKKYETFINKTLRWISQYRIVPKPFPLKHQEALESTYQKSSEDASLVNSGKWLTERETECSQNCDQKRHSHKTFSRIEHIEGMKQVFINLRKMKSYQASFSTVMVRPEINCQNKTEDSKKYVELKQYATE